LCIPGRQLGALPAHQFHESVGATRNRSRHRFGEYYNGLVATFEEAIRKEKRQHFVQTQADPHTLALLMVALYSGLQNYEMVWMFHKDIRDLWLTGMKILLKPTYNSSYGEGKNGAERLMKKVLSGAGLPART
jgi:hypothetical protein